MVKDKLEGTPLLMEVMIQPMPVQILIQIMVTIRTMMPILMLEIMDKLMVVLIQWPLLIKEQLV